MNIYIAGDHSKLHCGCQAVIQYLKNTINKKYSLTDSYQLADAVVVNGEGTMHHNSKGFEKKMQLLQKSKSDGKKAYLINSVWEANNNHYDKLLRELDGIVVREIVSQKELRNKHHINSQLRLDFSYFCDVDEKATDFTDFKSKVSITDFYSKGFDGWVRYSSGSKARHHYLDMTGYSWSGFIKTLKTSSMLITGRHHAVYAACKAEIPFVSLESNTHKISGFIKTTGFPIPVCNKPNEMNKAIKWAEDNKNLYSEFFDYLRVQPKFELKDIGL